MGMVLGCVPQLNHERFQGLNALNMEADFGLFMREIYPVLHSSQGCVTCHGHSSTTSQMPPFASEDPALAFATVKRFVNFSAPANSAIAVRSENNHCGNPARCGPGAQRRATLTDAITRWATLLSHAGGGQVGAPISYPYTDYLSCQTGQPTSLDVPVRMTRKQYIEAALAGINENGFLNHGGAPNVLFQRTIAGAGAASAAQIPDDGQPGQFARQDNRISATHLEGYLSLAQSAVDYLAGDAAAFARFAGACASVAIPDNLCIQNYIRKLARVFLYRPLDTTEETEFFNRFQASQGTSMQKLLMLLRSFLLHPELVLNLSYRGPIVAGTTDRQALTAFELAKKLSFTYEDRPPSNGLYQDALSGALTANPATLQAHLEGFIAGTPQGSYNFPVYENHFTLYDFMREWTDFAGFRGFPDGRLRQHRYPSPVFDFYAGNQNWLGEAQSELYAYSFNRIYNANANFEDFMTSTRGSVGPHFSNIYNVPAGNDQELGPQRPGPISRIGFLASGDLYPNEIIFGVRVLKNFLCREIPSPNFAELSAGFRMGSPRSAHPEWSTRDYVNDLTSANACRTCHNTINPVGALAGRYDGAGGYDPANGREEILELINNTPQVVGTPTIDDRAAILIDGQTAAVDGIPGLARALGESTEASVCLSRKFFTFAMRRVPTPQDACMIRSLHEKNRDQSIRSMWKGLGEHGDFRVRRITRQ